MSINLEKKISLVKTVLEEKKIIDVKGQVVLALDISASMGGLFNNGTVQDLVERLLAIGVNMDLDQQIDVHLFGHSAHKAASAKLSNIEGYVSKQVTAKYNLEGGTRYAQAMQNIADEHGVVTAPKKGLFSRLLGKSDSNNSSAKAPTIVFFVTDGENSDKPATTKLIQELSKQGIFWQFVGIGGSSFRYLSKLDELSGRYIDNANFFEANDISKISDEQLYQRILGELPDWIAAARNKGLID